MMSILASEVTSVLAYGNLRRMLIKAEFATNAFHTVPAGADCAESTILVPVGSPSLSGEAPLHVAAIQGLINYFYVHQSALKHSTP